MTKSKFHPSTITAVAQLIGLDLVNTYEELPAMFRINWEKAEEAGAFDGLNRIGEFKIAYCQHLIKRTVQELIASDR